MKWRNESWPERPPRPKVAALPRETLQRLHAQTKHFVDASIILSELLGEVQLARGRIYLRRTPDDVMARITPIGPRTMLLESPRGSSWSEHKRGQLTTVLKVVESDALGTFHGLGALVAEPPQKNPAAQAILSRNFGIPVRVLAEPRYWYSMHRQPLISEVNETKDRVLVNFVSHGFSDSFEGTCLYALRDGTWGCYTIRPNASESISTAQEWLEKRKWEPWD